MIWTIRKVVILSALVFLLGSLLQLIFLEQLYHNPLAFVIIIFVLAYFILFLSIGSLKNEILDLELKKNIMNEERIEKWKKIKDAFFEQFGDVPIFIVIMFFSAIISGLCVYWLLNIQIAPYNIFDILNSFGTFWLYTIISLVGILVFSSMVTILFITFEWVVRFYKSDRNERRK